MDTEINQSIKRGKTRNQLNPIAKRYIGITNPNDLLNPLIHSKSVAGIIDDIFAKYVFCFKVNFKQGTKNNVAANIGKQNQLSVNKLLTAKGNIISRYSEYISTCGFRIWIYTNCLSFL
jgi:hypothetical protein